MDVPILNIESIGCKCMDGDGNGYPCKYFLASLEFTKKFLFQTYLIPYYIPIKFYEEDNIKEIFKYYDNLYFQIIVFNRFMLDRKTKEYHISEYKNIPKILRKEYWKANSTDARGFTIDFKIKYKNANILIINYSHKFDIDFITKFTYNINIKNEFLNFFKNHYSSFPGIYRYTVNRNGEDDKDFNSIKAAINYIDNEIDKEKKLNDKIESYYSLKSFKLVENL